MPHFTVRKKKLDRTEQLDRLARACGQVWTRTALRFWRTYRKRGVWLSMYTMQQWMCTDKIKATPEHEALHAFAGRRENAALCRTDRESTEDDPHMVDERCMASQTRQGVVRSFYDALKTWRQAKGKMHSGGNTGFRPPHRRKMFYKMQWNYTGIKKRDGRLRLTCGRGNDPIWIDWPHPVPVAVEIGWDGEQYELRAKYKSSQEDLPDDFIRTREPQGDETVGIDLGEKYLATATDGKRTLLLGGERLRHLRAVQNKEKRWFASRIDRKKKGSNRFWKLVNAKRKRLSDLGNRIDDVLHKQTTRLVEEVWAWGASTLVVGKITGIRDRMDFGADMNRRLHQWAFRRFTQLLEYKADRYGMTVAYVGEAYTSQTCPHCGTAKRSHKRGRRFRCSSCGFEAHRDQVGARNIREKYLAAQSQDPGAWRKGYLEADRATATAPPEESSSGDGAKGSPSGRKTQLGLFDPRAAVLTRATPHKGAKRPRLEPPRRIRYRPHMTCILADP
jgi:putative transposase